MELLKGTKNILLLKTSRGKWLKFSKIFADHRRVNRINKIIKEYGEASLICAGSCGDEDGDMNIQGFYRKEEDFLEIFRILQAPHGTPGQWEWSWRGLVWTEEDAEMLAKYGVAI